MNAIAMNNECLISVIVPVYNSELYIERCIKSIVTQSYSNLEIILVDDGSKDNSLHICKEYCEIDSRIIVLHQENKGVSAARNIGLNAATGQYITFVDSDDELYGDAIKKLLDNALLYNADISSGRKCTVNEQQEIISLYENDRVYIYKELDTLCLSLEGNSQTNSACAKLFKKSFLGDIRFINGKNINEDGFFLFQCFVKKPIFVQHDISVYKYVIHEHSNSRGEFSEKYLDMLYFCQRKIDIVSELFPQYLTKAYSMEVRTNIRFLQVLCHTKKNFKVYEKNSIKTIKKRLKYFVPNDIREKLLVIVISIGLFPIYKFLIKGKRVVKNKFEHLPSIHKKCGRQIKKCD